MQSWVVRINFLGFRERFGAKYFGLIPLSIMKSEKMQFNFGFCFECDVKSIWKLLANSWDEKVLYKIYRVFWFSA